MESGSRQYFLATCSAITPSERTHVAANAHVCPWHDPDNRGAATTSAVLWGNNERAKRVDRMTALDPKTEANNPQQSWGFEGEPPEAVTKDTGTRDGTS